MQGLWLENNVLQHRTDLPIPEPHVGEVLVQVLMAGICNTDLELIKGYYPYTGILGHEFVGQVVRGPNHLQGKRVVGEINAACGQCDYCHRHLSNHCEQRTVLGIVNHHGAFAEYLTLPTENLHPIPDHLPNHIATFTEPLAAALEIQEQVEIDPSDRVLVIGDGKLGQLVAQTLARTGCQLSVVGRHPEKLANLAVRQITTCLESEINNHLRSFDFAVECTGNPQGFELARKALRPRGTLVLKSTYANHLTIDASAIVVDELTIIGSRCGPFAKALDLLATDAVDVAPLIQATFPLAQGIEAFTIAQQRGSKKILLTMTD
ncbi:alcohol dehydrogenase catalytic domain-containing protein [Acaryochloris sp. IP29b_bin.137]|uniref:MDR/zinc-dependent alcohol dehydrogenase-like family protein n=1 Tax=Acaryochloris sp. IP29b_bin.137 TaxID=2969217 RepID=UPI0026022AFF|nr:alcohol dehydrogenase catalytic domain-containing protein [Acaryochloris sp. IP29b_bin.137]